MHYGLIKSGLQLWLIVCNSFYVYTHDVYKFSFTFYFFCCRKTLTVLICFLTNFLFVVYNCSTRYSLRGSREGKSVLDRESAKNLNLFVQKTAVVRLKNPGLPEQFGQPWNAEADFWTAKITN